MSAVTAVPIRPIARGSLLKLWIGLALLLAAGAGLAWLGTAPVQRTATASGLQYQVIREGEGAAITSEDMVLIHFVGRRENGEIFANTRGGRPMETATDNFIPGFGEGLKLMRKGAVYRFWIPPILGYQGQVPPTAPFGPEETLVFEIQVVEVGPGMAAIQRQQQMQQLQQQMQSQSGATPAGPNPHGATLPPDAGAPPPQGPPGGGR